MATTPKYPKYTIDAILCRGCPIRLSPLYLCYGRYPVKLLSVARVRKLFSLCDCPHRPPLREILASPALPVEVLL